MARKPLYDPAALARATNTATDGKEFTVARLIDTKAKLIRDEYRKRATGDVERELPTDRDDLRHWVFLTVRRRPELFRNTMHGHYVPIQKSDASLSAEAKLQEAIDAHNKSVRDEFFIRLEKMKDELGAGPKAGDALVAFAKRFLSDLGFEVSESSVASGDGGVDAVGRRVDELGQAHDFVIQLKHWKRSSALPRVAVTELKATLAVDGRGSHRAVLLTTAEVSEPAAKEARTSSRVTVVDGESLFNLCVDNEVGVRRNHVEELHTDLLFLDPKWFDEVEEELPALRHASDE